MDSSDHVVLDNWLSRRDPDAFRAIIQRHAAMVYGTCRRILGNDSEAEDVAQECFEALVKSAASDPPRDLGPWLHGVATNRSAMRLRAEGRRRQRETCYAAARPERAAPSWDDVYENVDEAIAALPADLRAPVVAHFLYGHSHSRIARDIGKPRRTVSNRINKAVALIGESLLFG